MNMIKQNETFIRDADLKRQLTSRVLASRRQAIHAELPYTPRYAEMDQVIQPDGRRVRRLKVILMSKGCSVPTCTMCAFTNENNYGQRDVADEIMVEQVRDILRKGGPITDCDCVSLYNDGFFFAPHEIKDETRILIAGLVAQSGVSLLTVESLPQFVTEARLLPVLDALGDVKLDIGLGLQSAHPQVREYCVNTSVDNNSYERAVKLLQRHGVQIKTYIMLKPPFLTENEAIADALQSIDYCNSLGSPYVTLCPTSVSPNTLVWDLMKAGKYHSLNLWSIVDTAIRAPQEVTLRIVGINLRGANFVSTFPDSCPKCSENVRKSIGQFSLGNFDLRELDRCSCAPSPDIPVNTIDGNILMDRIRNTLSQLPSRTLTP
jgi:radical SAM enzyme (TIGR01210 family)